MGIARFFSILLISIGLIVVVAFSRSIQKTVEYYFQVTAMATLSDARTDWANGTVALSLERSVTQVSLALEGPIPEEFRTIIDDQRSASDEFLRSAGVQIEQQLDVLKAGTKFVSNAQRIRTNIQALRSEVDALLAVPLAERSAERTKQLPAELKTNIALLQGLTELLKIDSAAKSDNSIGIDALQARSWEIREYGGRARTYLAIATLTGKPLSPEDRIAVQIDSTRAQEAWSAIQNVQFFTELAPELQQQLNAAGEQYFGEYVPLTERLLEVSRATEPGADANYPLDFIQFFTTSSEALAQFEQLVVGVGEHSIGYWDGRQDTATIELILKIGGLVTMVLGLIIVMRIVVKRVTSRVESATDALCKVAEGDLEVKLSLQKMELKEILKLNESLTELQSRLLVARAAEQDRLAAEQDRLASEAERKEQQRQQQVVVDALSAELAKLAEGDLSCRIEQVFEGSYEALRNDFNTSCERLDQLIGDVVGLANAIGLTANELASSTDEVQRQTSDQADTASQTTDAVEMVAGLVQSTATRASETAENVKSASASADQGGEVVGQAVDAMREIKASSDRIAQIVSLIDEIAFQTNLLALNAGVEAARAGESGRGFAVVATEVRALAQRSSEAAQEIGAVISKSSEQVERGVDLVGQTGSSLEEIVGKVKNINTLAAEISSATKDQSDNLKDMSVTVGDLKSSAVRTVEMSQTSNANSAKLQDQALQLRDYASFFKTTGQPNARTKAA